MEQSRHPTGCRDARGGLWGGPRVRNLLSALDCLCSGRDRFRDATKRYDAVTVARWLTGTTGVEVGVCVASWFFFSNDAFTLGTLLCPSTGSSWRASEASSRDLFDNDLTNLRHIAVCTPQCCTVTVREIFQPPIDLPIDCFCLLAITRGLLAMMLLYGRVIPNVATIA